MIRSNRPLYRACPKHTKLLVSKAIVQAVEQQGGRFLDRDKKSGKWVAVSYKRAVDKTSQGLRERDREEDATRQAAIPDSFSGRSNNPDLNDLAAVAIAHANRSASQGSQAVDPTGSKRSGAADERQAKRPRTNNSTEEDFSPLPPSIQPRESSMFRLLKSANALKGSWSGQPPQQQQMNQKRLQSSTVYPTTLKNYIAPSDGVSTKPSLLDDDNSNMTNQQQFISGGAFGPSGMLQQQHQMPQFQQLNNIQSEQPSMGQQQASMVNPSLTQFAALTSSNTVLGAMTPTMMQQSNGQIPGVMGSQAVDGQVSSQGSASSSSVGYRNSNHSESFSGALGVSSESTVAQGNTSNTMGQVVTSPAAASSMTMAAQPAPAGTGPTDEAAPAPTLTRLTTQVSDWLKNSFWPVSQQQPKKDKKMSRPLAFGTATAISTLIPPPAEGNGYGRNNEGSSGLRITTIPPPSAPKPVQINTIPPIWGKPGEILSNSGVPSSQTTSQQQSNEKSEVEEAPKMPSEVERSVSASLLALASTPTNFFNGLSSFFGDNSAGNNGSSVASQQAAMTPTPLPSTATLPSTPTDVAAQHSSAVGFKKSARSLLDDDDETPAEARLRSVPWQ